MTPTVRHHLGAFSSNHQVDQKKRAYFVLVRVSSCHVLSDDNARLVQVEFRKLRRIRTFQSFVRIVSHRRMDTLRMSCSCV